MAALVAATGLHANTLREHLEALVRRGLVRRLRAQPHGRGRPALLYEATDAETSPDRSEYAGLAATLASAINRTSSSPRDDAVVAGTEWGHELARRSGGPATATDGAARREVLTLLDRIGFAPEPGAEPSAVRLTRCPLLEAAYKYPDVVCGVHLGIVRGALEEYGADPAGTDLIPFAEPGACRLELRIGAGPDRP
jgi:predicted ArsR family transcriptional regulator